MKTGIVIITYNIDTRIFLMQIGCLKKYCKDNFTIEIIDNSSDQEMAEAINYHAGLYGINYKRVLSSQKDSSKSHSFAANLAYTFFKDKYDILFYLDHDCLPVDSFSCDEILGQNIFGGIAQKKLKTYLWPGCFMVRNTVEKPLVNFSPNAIFQLDTGGNLYHLLEKYGEEKCVFFTESYLENVEYNGEGNNFFSVINDIFYHCIGASNWMNLADNHARINSFINVVAEKINAPE